MADSTLTKQALALSLKNLLREIPFEKISISQICNQCHMNRKSFYYHFKDKYDLVNWIFDSEYISTLEDNIYSDRWEFLETLSIYFYSNKDFYRKVFKITGQNSFTEHFQEYLYPIIKRRLEGSIGNEHATDFSINILTDLFISAYNRWLSEKECMSPTQFVSLIQSLTTSVSVHLCENCSTNSKI